MKDKPLITIGIPVYNGEDFIRDCLNSICNQTYENLEIIISDNASDDHTSEICEEFAAKDLRIKYFRNKKNLGAAPNYNKVFELSSGEFFKWQAHDDMIEKDFIEKCANVLLQYKDVSLVYAKRSVIDKLGKKIKDIDDKLFFFDDLPSKRFGQFMKRFAKSTEYCDPIFGLIRTSSLKQTRLFGSFHTSDMILLAELLLNGKFFEIDERLFLRRIHEKISTNSYPDPKSRALWFNTNNKIKFSFHYFKWLLEFIKTISRSNINIEEKLICFYHLFVWSLKLWKGFAVNIRDAAIDSAPMLLSFFKKKINSKEIKQIKYLAIKNGENI